MGLVAYDSSDEDDDVQVDTPTVTQNTKKVTSSQPPPNDDVTANGQIETTLSQPPVPQPPAPSNEPLPQPEQQSQPAPRPSPSTPLSPVLGPALGPSMPPPIDAASSTTLLPDPDDSNVDMSFLDPSTTTGLPSASSSAEAQEPPKSPYTATRTLLHDLTLPAIPNMDIPASPVLSPSSDISSVERLAALTSKFDKFLELKRTKGQHFNSRIAQSAATKNPGLMDKLVRFVGVETEVWFDDLPPAVQNNTDEDKIGAQAQTPAGWEQYATTLSKEIWDPSSLPGWAYRESLRKTQERMQKENERKRGERVEFVSGGTATTANGMTSRNGSATPLGSVAYSGGMSGCTGTKSGTGTPSAGASTTTAGVKRKSRFDT